ncbi:uncharacterized protein LOC126635382 isoform X2 [Myiozetetes cayanensis]|uniref:uncharacterized protein LOC126635382 isoform X2 n=1 Tax=Myiozetetes cayanensis TaxID=478635 RepID=UPI00215E0753|nr:uncharacterized protein LOC126635382 isoform X2 [Myiozetetes cayanensis]
MKHVIGSPSLHFTAHKPQKITVWKKHTGPTHPVHLTQSTAHFGILSFLKESHISFSTARADLAKTNSDQLSIENTFCRRTLLPNANKREVWETASSVHKRLKYDGQRRVLTFEDAVKSMEFCCSGCFSEHSTLSALTPKIAT